MGAIGKTVEGGVGEDGVGEESHPLGNVAVAGDDEAGLAVAFDDEGVEVFRLLLVEPLETEVIDDKQVGSEVAAKDRLGAVVGARLAEFAEEQVAAPEKDLVAGTGGGGAKRLGEEGLAHADRADQEDVLLLGEEVQGKQFVEVAAVELDSSGPIEIVEGNAFLEARGGEAAFECPEFLPITAWVGILRRRGPV